MKTATQAPARLRGRHKLRVVSFDGPPPTAFSHRTIHTFAGGKLTFVVEVRTYDQMDLMTRAEYDEVFDLTVRAPGLGWVTMRTPRDEREVAEIEEERLREMLVSDRSIPPRD